MNGTATRRQRQPEVGPYTAVILSSADEVRSLKPLLRSSMSTDDVLFDPEFYLSSLGRRGKPRVAAVYSGTALIGVIYANLMTFSRYPVGIVHADLSLGAILLGDTRGQVQAFRTALKSLLDRPGTRGIRLRIPRAGPERAAVRQLIGSRKLDVHFRRIKEHAVLCLPNTYEQLLLSFGGTTRHNFRYYRRRFEHAGHAYVENLSLDELRSAADYLRSRCTIPQKSGGIERILRMVGVADRPLAVGLKHKNGEWLAVIGGVYRPTSGVLLLQLNNDRNFPRDSLSVVLRGYLIESLIRQGMREFIIWAGTSAPLSRYAKYIHTLGVYLDFPNPSWRLTRRLVSILGPWLPQDFRFTARWIAPFR